MSKLNDSTTLLVSSPPKLHNFLNHYDLHDVLIQGPRLPGVTNLQRKGVAGSRPGGCHILPLSQQLPVVLLARPPDDEVDASYS